MTAVDRSNAVTGPGLSAFGSAPGSGPDPAARIMADVGQRIAAWTDMLAGGRASSGFRPDPHELQRRGDVYGLRQLAAEAAATMGATPTQEGALLRALENFTRAAAVHIYGLAGAEPAQRFAALSAAGGADASPATIDALTSRIESAARDLARQAGL